MSVLLIVIPTEYATKSPSIKVNMGTQRPGPTPTPTEGPVLVETKLSMCLYHFLNSKCVQRELMPLYFWKNTCQISKNNILLSQSMLCTLP